MTTSEEPTANKALLRAVRTLIEAHPMLRVTIHGQDSDYSYHAADSIDLSNHIFTTTIACSSAEEYRQLLAEKQADLHNHKFQNISTIPPWEIIAIRAKSTSSDFVPEDSEEIFLHWHHSLFDGVSGRYFHEGLLAALNADVEEGDAAVSFAVKTDRVPLPEEEAVPFTISTGFMLGVLWNEFGPSFLKKAPMEFWAGKNVNISNPYKTGTMPIDVSGDALKSLLAACRENKTSLTGLLHSLLLLAFAKHVGDASAFSTTTTIGMHPYVKDDAPESTLRELTSSYVHPFDVKAVKLFRDGVTDQQIWVTAAELRAGLAARLTELPKDDLIPMLKYVSDWESWWAKKDGLPRANTWEISNLGVFKQEQGGKFKITRVFFSNGAMVTGSPMSFNMASVAGGGLTVCVSWDDNALPRELVDKVSQELESLLANYKEKGNFVEEI